MERLSISISNRFFLYSLALFVAIFSYLSYLFFQQQRVQNDKLVTRLSNDLSIMVKSLEDSIRYNDLLVQNIILRINKKPKDQHYIQSILESSRLSYKGDSKNILSISVYSWIDKDFKIKINSEFGKLNDFKDVTDRDYIPLIINEPGKLKFGRPVISKTSNQYIIPAAIGFVDKQDKFSGAIVMGYDIFSIYNRLVKEKSTEDAYVQLIYKKEQALIKNSFNLQKSELEKINLIDSNVQILRNFSIFSGSSVLIYKKIENSPYGVLLKLDNQNHFNFDAKRNYIIELISIFAAFIILIYFLKKDFINPVLSLSKSARSLSAGNRNVVIPTYKIKEINQLSKALSAIKESFSKQREISEKNVKQNLSKSAFLSTISHELRSSVAGISMAAELILIAQLTEEEKIEYIKDIQNFCEEHSKFVNDLLDIGQVESGNFELGMLREEEVEDLIKRSIRIIKGGAVKNGIRIITNVEKDLPKLKCDARKIKQILVNLLTNSIKYSSPQTAVTISAGTIDNRIYISVKDQGFGMSLEDIERALERFQTLDNENRGKVDSFGLGLPLIKYLIELHKGTLEIKSALNKGSEFIITFPQ